MLPWQILTLSGWARVMHAVRVGVSAWTWVYFAVLVVFGPVIGVAFFLAVRDKFVGFLIEDLFLDRNSW